MKYKLSTDKFIFFVVGACLLIYIFIDILFNNPMQAPDYLRNTTSPSNSVNHVNNPFHESFASPNFYEPNNAENHAETGKLPYPDKVSSQPKETQSILDAVENAQRPKTTLAPALAPASATSSAITKSEYALSPDATLNQYSIYAAYNAAYDGQNTTIDQLADIMAMGVRWIHLNIAYIIPPQIHDKSAAALQQSREKLWVVFASSPKDASAPKTLPLSAALKYIGAFAFTTDPTALARVQQKKLSVGQRALGKDATQNGCSIQQDAMKQPLFVHITATSPNVCTNKNTDIFSILQEEYLNTNNDKGLISKSKLYQDKSGSAVQITAKTLLADIQETIQFSFDIDNMVSYYTNTGDASQIYPNDKDRRGFIQKSFNVKTGGSTLSSKNSYNTVLSMQKMPIIVNDNSTKVSFPSTIVNTWNVAFPAITDTDNPDPYIFTASYGMNIVPNRFYISGKNLDKYNNMFTNACTPLLPLTTAVRYINKQNLLTNP